MTNENKTMTADYQSTKSISLKNCGISIPVGGGDFLNTVVLLFSGIATSFDLKQTQYGESVVLMGQFMAVNAITGESFDASLAYLPDDFAAGIRKQIENSDGDVKIGFDHPVEILVAPSERGARGYTFIVRSASTPEIVNRKGQMAAAMLNTLDALPAGVTLKALPTPEKEPKLKSA